MSSELCLTTNAVAIVSTVLGIQKVIEIMIEHTIPEG